MSALRAAALAVVLAATAGAHAATVYSHDFSGLGAQASPGSISDAFSAGAGSATLSLTLNGYISLDGWGNCCTDVFHLTVNGVEIFTGSFNMGGGGSNTILFNPNGGTALTTTFGASGDPHNSTDVTFQGGVTQISVPVTLLAGSNNVEFSYTGAAQGLGDEGWGVGQVTIAGAVPEPGSYALLLAGLAGVGAVVRRRSAAR